MKVNIINPDTTIFDGEVKDAFFIGIDGHFEIRQNHAPIVSVLAKGDIKLIDNNNQEHIFPINGGLLEMSNNTIQILAK